VSGDALLSLLHLCDSLFPLGAFAHSDGLEAATSARQVADADGLRNWMSACLDETCRRADGPAFVHAWHAATSGRWSDVRAVNIEITALRPSSASRQAARAMGARLLKTWRHIHPDSAPAIGEAGGETLALPVAFAVVCAAAGVPLPAALAGYFYTRLAATASAGMRLIAIGQYEAHALVATFLARVPAIVDAVIERSEPPSSFTPALDIAVMGQQFVHSRLFRS